MSGRKGRDRRTPRSGQRRLQFESLESRVVFSIDGLEAAGSVAPVTAETEEVAPAAILDSLVSTLPYYRFNEVEPWQVPLLTTAQIASIPSPGYLGIFSDAARAALSMPQIRSLRVGDVRIYLLTPQQVSWLTTDQVRSLDRVDFRYLQPAQIPLLTPAQIATIPDAGLFGQLSDEARARLTVAQVQALNVATVRLHLLTPTQISWLTTAQIQSVDFFQFKYLSPSQVVQLTPAQIATIPDPGIFSAWSDAERGALTIAQVQALRVETVRINLLTPTQVGWLSAAQVRTLRFPDFPNLNPSQIAWLTPAQVGTIPDIGAFHLWPAASRAALTVPQVQALDVSEVRIELLSPLQVSWLTTAQIQTLDLFQFKSLWASQIPLLTPAQIATIPDPGTFVQWTDGARAALTAPQVQALRVATIGLELLTPTQVGWLTTAQVQSLNHFQFVHLTPAKTPLLTPAQIASIPDPGTFVRWTVAARAALTAAQVQALRVPAVGINLLTPQQVGWLTTAQVRALDFFEFQYLSPAQVPSLTPAQVATIPDPGPFVTWTSAARAALTVAQVQALRVASVKIDLLTPQQVGWLTTAQVQSLDYFQFVNLNAAQIPLLTAAQIATIPDPGPFVTWTAAARAALTRVQVQALRVASIGIELLTPDQIGLLLTTQIRALKVWDIPRLHAWQLPRVSNAQFAAITDASLLLGMPDDKQASLRREQLLNLPFDVLSNFMRVESTQLPPEDYVPSEPYGHHLPGNLQNEAADIYRLVPLATATHFSIADGDWSDPSIWADGVVPGPGARVVINTGTVVRFDAYLTSAIFTLRIDGTLEFATNINTQLKVDTVVVGMSGALHIGTTIDPIRDNVTARILIAGNGPINTAWDPYLLSRGLLSMGEVRMVGRAVTPYATLTAEPRAGQTLLQFTEVPAGWRVGDELVIAGTNLNLDNFGIDRVRIRGISGSTVYIDPLQFDHAMPDAAGITIQAANLTRNVQLVAEDATVFIQRPHLMFLHNPDVALAYVGVYGFGRTDKNVPINSSVVQNGVLQPGTGTNPRARYAMHFHHTGVNPESAPAVVVGSLVLGSPGWGFVNHSSNVVMVKNVAFNVVGAGFAAEDGNEIGVMQGNYSLYSVGSDDFILSRRDIHDWGHGGHGFWFQGPGVQAIGNIAANNRGGAFAYVTSSSRTMFDAVNLPNQALAAGKSAVPVGTVPLAAFDGNIAHTSQMGLELWFHQTMLPTGETLIKNFTAWNISMFGINLQYAGNVTVDNARLFGNRTAYSGLGVMTNRLTHNLQVRDSWIEGFGVGVKAAARRTTVISGGYYKNVQNLLVEKGQDTVRSVYIMSPQFATPTTKQLDGRDAYNIVLDGSYSFDSFLDRAVSSLLSRDWIHATLTSGFSSPLYFPEQAGSYIPFPASTSTGRVPAGYLNKTNAQLRAEFGVSFGGELLPAGVLPLPGVYAYARG